MASNPPTISNLPATPDRADRPTFSARCVAMFDALKNAFVSEVNALAAWMKSTADEVQVNANSAGNSASNASGYAGLAQDWATKTSGEVVSGQGYGAKKYAQDAAAAAASALNAPGTSATSTSSIAIGTGSKTFSIQPGKAFAVGQFVVAAKTTVPGNYIVGQITAHDSAAGILEINGMKVGGSGTHADWTISLGPDGNSAGTGANTFTGTQTLSGAVVNEAQGSDIASAGTINLNEATGNLVDVTGTTTITAVTLTQGAERTVRFTGSLTLTHGASLILPGAANITTSPGDFAIFRGYAAGVVRCVIYTKASGQSVSGVSVGDHAIVVHSGNGYGTTATAIRRFTTNSVNTGTAITYADSAANGASFTINETGIYSIQFEDISVNSGLESAVGASVNSSQLTTEIANITVANRIFMAPSAASPWPAVGSAVVRLTAGDVVRPHQGPGGYSSNANAKTRFVIRKVGL